MKHTVYIETSIVSYYTSRPSRDLVVAAHQQITREWWEHHRAQLDTYISTLVIQEAEAGDPSAAKLRLDVIEDLPVLELNEDVLKLASNLVEKGPIPPEFFEDALHIAVATVNGMEFLLTWNCHHINNPRIRPDIVRIVDTFGYECPVICTPDEFMGGAI